MEGDAKMKKFLSVFVKVTTALVAVGGAAFAVKKVLDKKAEQDLFDEFDDEDFEDTFESEEEDDEAKRENVSIHIPSETTEEEAPAEDVAEEEAPVEETAEEEVTEE